VTDRIEPVGRRRDPMAVEPIVLLTVEREQRRREREERRRRRQPQAPQALPAPADDDGDDVPPRLDLRA
jgi:hypothetical protein